MHAFMRSAEPYLHVERLPVEGSCPECLDQELAEYDVMAEGGWWHVVKCQSCLASVSRKQGPMFGSYVPLALQM